MWQLFNMDCLEFMRRIPDGAFDLTIADPPYGIGADWHKRGKNTRVKFEDFTYANVRPAAPVFSEILRVSKHWIIWGWNYFTDILPPTNYLIVWDKASNQNQKLPCSHAEIAGTDIRIPCNLVTIQWDGYRMGEETGHKKIHPHQKPLALYRWLLDYYGHGASTVFDPFAGSASLGVVCIERGLDYTGCELEAGFHKAALCRLRGEDFKPPRKIDFSPRLQFNTSKGAS
ncbi:MAG: site-specific DNA-methyltransferase [Kiritimatiellae bacterium]|nr:site-specific DNA-methyltransferase [Kiritimatiellia bacterium]